jgi:plastocyanin
MRMIFSPRLLAASLLLAASAGLTQPVTHAVELTNFDFSPDEIHLKAGEPILLRLENSADGGHNFSAPEFFARARVQADSAALIKSGKVEVPANSFVEISLTPAAGEYKLKCTHTLHSGLGMTGKILVH